MTCRAHTRARVRTVRRRRLSARRRLHVRRAATIQARPQTQARAPRFHDTNPSLPQPPSRDIHPSLPTKQTISGASRPSSVASHLRPDHRGPASHSTAPRARRAAFVASRAPAAHLATPPLQVRARVRLAAHQRAHTARRPTVPPWLGAAGSAPHLERAQDLRAQQRAVRGDQQVEPLHHIEKDLVLAVLDTCRAEASAARTGCDALPQGYARKR